MELSEDISLYRTLLEALPLGIVQNTPEGEILYYNRRAREILGYEGADFAPLNARDLYVEPADREKLIENLKDKGFHEYAHRLRRQDGRIIWVQGASWQIRDPKRGGVYLGYLEDITDQQQGQEELFRAHRQLRSLSWRLPVVRTAERLRLVRELRDPLGSRLEGVQEALSRWQAARLEAPGEVRDSCASLMTAVEGGLQFLKDLGPEDLAPLRLEQGLGPAFAWLGRDFQQCTGRSLIMDLPPESPEYDAELALELFYIAQELLHYAAYHVRANQVHLRLQAAPDAFLLQIDYEGPGHEWNEASEEPEGLGLLGVRARVHLWGGEFRLAEVAPQGTRLWVCLPHPEPRIERVDSIPLIFHCLMRMKVVERIDVIWRPHSNWEGLSYGELAVLFLTYVLYMHTHRLCSMEEWVEQHRTTLEAVSGWPIGPREGTDDRLGRLLEVLGRNDDIMYLFQRDLGKQLIQAYNLPTEVARFDTSTFSVHHAAAAEGEEVDLMPFGPSKDRRPDWRQFKQGLGTLDPAGIPLVTQTLSGETADDGLYLPAWRAMRQTIGRPDFLFVADGKAAALTTRATLAQEGGAYLFPLPMTGAVPDLLRTWVLDPCCPRETICLDTLGIGDQKKGVVGQGFVVERAMEIPREEEEPYRWTERWLVTQSDAQAHRQQQALDRRLVQAEHALDPLTPRKKDSVQDVQTRVHTILTRYKVEGLIQVAVSETTSPRKRFLGRGRPGPDRPFQLVTEHQIHLSYHRQEAAIDEQRPLAGWRIHVTNTPQERLSLPQAIAYYRDEWLLERGFHRFKKGTLPALPLWLRLPERIKGLMRLLLVALQALTLMEFVVARALADREESFSGLVPGNPKMKTARPSAERILTLFSYIHLLVEESAHQTTSRCVEALSPLQQQMLDLLDLPPTIYNLTCHRAREKIKIPA